MSSGSNPFDLSDVPAYIPAAQPKRRPSTASRRPAGPAGWRDAVSPRHVPLDDVPTPTRRSTEPDPAPAPAPDPEPERFSGNWNSWMDDDPEPGDSADTTAAGDPYDLEPEREGGDAVDDPYRPLTAPAGYYGPEPTRREKRRRDGGGFRPSTLLLAAVAGVALIVVVVVVNISMATSTETAAVTDAAAAPSDYGDVSPVVPPPVPPPGPLALDDCSPTNTALVRIGADAGSTNTPQDVIMAFEYAYYVDRSATAMLELTTPDARVGDAEAIQSGIDGVQDGTRYCTTITRGDSGPGSWNVALRVRPPGGDEHLVNQRIFTTETDDGYRITRVAHP